jgi:tRNA (mo5U34)-methyltransferase
MTEWSRMSSNDLRARVAALRWYHTIDLGDGIITNGVDDSPQRLAKLQLPASLEGLSVLDIGAWDGFFSFECERRGAARVVAADYFSWHGDGWGTKAAFMLAREVLGSSVEDIDVDVMELTPARIGTFDLVLFLGVLYHLRHPLLALERVSSVAHERLILETVVDMVGFSRPAMAFYPSKELNNDPTNWWGPNVPAVCGMLECLGFDEVQTVTQLPRAPYRAARAFYHQLRGKNTLAPAFRQDRAVFHGRKRRRPDQQKKGPTS